MVTARGGYRLVQGCIVVGEECVVTRTGLTVAKWHNLLLPRPSHKPKSSPLPRWCGAAGAGSHQEPDRARTRGVTRPEALGFHRSLQVRQTDSLSAADWLLPGLPPPQDHKRGKLSSREGHPVRAGESAPGSSFPPPLPHCIRRESSMFKISHT